MRTIHKYAVEVGLNTLKVPLGAEVLTVQKQYGLFAVWARVDDSELKGSRGFYLAMTGENLDRSGVAGWDYKGTVQDGEHVFHLLAEPS